MDKMSALLGDITTVAVDAIVNAANSWLAGGGGVDGAIHLAGGPSILEECRAIVARQGACRPGDAVVTGAGLLPAAHVIHTVGPIWSAVRSDEHDQTLARCYRRSLEEAARVGAATVAFPNISTGVYGFPKPRAARVAVGAVRDCLAHLDAIDHVTFVCFDDENFGLYQAQLGGSGEPS